MVLHQPDDSTVVTRTIHIAARPETVFAFFIDPLKMRQWKGINATLDPHPQGQFQVALNEQDTIRGEYVEVVPYRRIVFTWGWDAPDSLVPPGSSTVEIDLVPDANGTRWYGSPRRGSSPTISQHPQDTTTVSSD